MIRHYDLYIRPAAGMLNLELQTIDNILDGWDRLELLKAGSKIITEPEGQFLEDGTSLTEAIKIVMEAGTLRVDKAEFAYLRATYHNKLADVLLYDMESPETAVQVAYMRLAVEKVAESGGDILINIKGMCRTAVAAESLRLAMLDLGEAADIGMVMGQITDSNSVAVAGALIVCTDGDTNTFSDTSDKDGYYMISAPANAYSIVCFKPGMTFPEAAILKLIKNQVLTLDIKATA